MNTKIDYLYRDACNFKVFNTVIVSGTVEWALIQACLNDETHFIPSEVGLEDLQPGDLTSDDHIWHEIESIATTSEKPTIGVTAPQLLSRFKTAHGEGWNEYAVIKKRRLQGF